MPSSYKAWGFVYRITRLADGKDYIGSKSFTTKSNPWPGYKSSSKELSAEIESHGMDYLEHFSFELLMTCGDRNSLALAEMTMQIEEDVIHNSNNYNKAIAGQKFLGPTKHTPESRAKMARAKLGTTHSDEAKAKMSENSALKGVTGTDHPASRDIIVGIHTKTGERVEFNGEAELVAAGFNGGNARRCLAKKKYWNKVPSAPNGGYYVDFKTSQGYTWHWKGDLDE